MLSARTLQKIQAGILTILNSGFSESCCLCNRSAQRDLCDDCWRQVLACQQVKPIPSTAIHPPLLAWGSYQGSLKRAIAQMKYNHCPSLATRFGEELGLCWLERFPKLRSFQGVPIPLHRDRNAERGYNQAELIARRFCQVVGVPCIRHGLVRNRNTQAQHTLAPGQRASNLRGAFSVGKGLKNSSIPILLIDDIFTTGTTIAEARRVLHRSNRKTLGAAVIAQAPFEGT